MSWEQKTLQRILKKNKDAASDVESNTPSHFASPVKSVHGKTVSNSFAKKKFVRAKIFGGGEKPQLFECEVSSFQDLSEYWLLIMVVSKLELIGM